MDSLSIEEKTVIEAATIFLLMKKNFPISRNIRAQWILDHLDTVITIVDPRIDKYETSELEIISVIPKNCPASWNEKNSHQYQYKVSTSTSIVFLAHKYKMVFCLDLSPSLGTIDIQNGEIVMDEVCLATKQCLENISQPFLVPGSNYILQPEIYVTIIVHTPFLTNPAQQVLIQGWIITTDNVDCLMRFIEKKLNCLEEKIALVMRATHQHRENFRVENDGLVSGLFDEKSSERASSTYASNERISVISPDVSFHNILRYGQLALSLLPINSCAHLVIVSDGIVGITDTYALDSVIQQFRASTVACSFIQIGTAYHPHCANGMVPYQDVLCFLATATLGSHMTLMSPSEQTCEFVPFTKQINKYQDNFLCWKLYRSETCSDAHHSNYWHTNNMLFYAHQHPQLLRKKQLDDKVICTLSNLMCCRLRDGYLIKKITLKDGCMEICFILPWKTHVFLEYLVSSPWPLKSLAPCKLQYTITAEAPYEFLHDITCLLKKPLKSQYRQSIVSRFWATVTSLTENNNMLEHFSRLLEPGWMWYNVPDTIKSGMPVFNLSAYPSASTLQLSDSSCPQFGKIWQPVASLDPNQWARWMHSQCITLVLAHDRPLPKYLHQANQSGRFQSVQSRQAAAALHAMLKAWASFVLVENHTYVQFIYRETEKPPVSFSVIRMNCKALCVVLNVAFAGGTEGIVRRNVMMDLINRLSTLTLPNRLTEQRETPCCVIIHKALEKILVRYERMPIELNNVILPDGTQQIFHKTDHIPVSISTTTLCRYLHYCRYVWNIKKPVIQTIPGITVPKLNITAIARVLSTITKIRLNEGFNFAYSSAGIINMVLEVQMEGSCNDFHSCVIQYIIFPPHTISSAILKGDSESEENTDGTGDEDGYNDDSETHEDYQIITEVWIEPQYGQVKYSENTALSYMNSLSYYQLSNAISRTDEECINALLTLEHLTLLSHVESEDGSPDTCTRYQQATQCGHSNRHLHRPLRRMSMPSFTQSRIFFDDLPDAHVNSNLFTFDALSILPKCQQVELLYSMFTDSISNDNDSSTNSILMDSLMDHMKRLHNTELIMNDFDNEKFTKMLFNRPRDDGGLSLFSKYLHEDQRNNNIRWRCFIKGITATHIVITFVPATEKDVKALTQPKTKSHKGSHNVPVRNLDSTKWYTQGSTEESQTPDWIDNSEEFVFSSNPHTCSSELNSSVHRTATETPLKFEKLRYKPSSRKESELILPIYVYDCSLLLLIDVLVGELNLQRPKDIFQNNIFSTDQHIVKEFINLKPLTECESTSPELKGDEIHHSTDGQCSLLKHCKILSLAHCHCYVMAVYKALSLQLPISYEDMEAAVEQCEESLIEINITKYLQTVCKHLHSSIKPTDDNASDSISLTCSEFQPLHNLIKEKFRKIITVAFKSVPTHPESYYCVPLQNSEFINPMKFHRSDSDEDLEEFIFHSESYDCKLDNSKGRPNVDSNSTWPNINRQNDPKMLSYDSTESILSDLREDANNEKEQPLFLQLSCSVHSGPYFSSIPVKLLPTCFADIKQRLDDYEESDISNIKISLDIICLNLPKEVLEVSLEQKSELKTTSYSSSSPVRSIDTSNESIPPNGTLSDNGLVNERLAHLPRYQHNAITNLKAEIDWLLRDEIATALLDTNLPTYETLDFVSRHVAESSGRTSCHLDRVPLHFVFSSTNSAPKFFQELINMEADQYIIHQQKEFLYFVKNTESVNYETTSRGNDTSVRNGKKSNKNKQTNNNSDGVQHSKNSRANRQNSNELPGCQSEISSIGDGHPATDDGYEGDSSNSEDDCCWLTSLDERRKYLPNFWLILQPKNNYVDVYFHCRFLDFVSPEVDRYRLIQKMVVSQIAVICRRVNQYLLLESLHDTRNCDYLLESDSHEDQGWRAESSNEVGVTTPHDSTVNMTPGMFRCSIVWEETFCLHPRLKTGPGRSGLSRGIKALHVVLSRFSVNNRDNMFVYRESNSNVFYLRLHERTSDGKSLQNKLSESDERLMVSRSNSIASLSHSRLSGHRMDPTKVDDTRPRVRSFGEKDSDYMHKSDDSIVLMVHGISEPGLEVRSELVQVLHNRLDDAVLEVLSVMLARNPMCKLTPADVHFIQKPYLPPESYVQFSVQQYYLKHMDALAYYLRQNILQFLYIPKYTDPRSHYHLQDYSQPEGSKGRVSETDIFLNNQSPSSGNRGIACIAMAIDKDYCSPQSNDFSSSLRISDFPKVISTTVYKSNVRSTTNPHGPIEFRIWKQGRVNLETLIEKLRAAINHAIWDLVTEYYLLRAPLNIPLSCNDSNEYMAKSNVSNIASDQVSSKYSSKYKLNSFELGKEGQFHDIYHKTLPCWFDFALNIGVSSVKKHIVTIQHRHPISMTVRELQNLIHINAPDTSTRSFVLHQSQPFVVQDYVSSETNLPFKQLEMLDDNKCFQDKCDSFEQEDNQMVYIPCDVSLDSLESYSKAIVIARNFCQWKASYNATPEPELLMPKDQKLLQKFNPLIQDSSFIPRQRLLLVEVQGDQFIIHMYNWSKERSEKLLKQATNLGRWLSSRSTLFSKIMMQKLGIFHHQLISSYNLQDDHAQQFCQMTDIEALAKFPSASATEEWSRSGNNRQNTKNINYSWERMVGQVMRDTKPNSNYPPNTIDSIVKAAYDLQDSHQRDRKSKENLTRLYTLWQSRSSAPNIPISVTNLNTFKQFSRLIHYCHTPILFLPQWRIQSAATRDHTLTSSSSTSLMATQVQSHNPHQQYGVPKLNNKKNAKTWHQELCISMISEYKQYLQLLGFNPLQVDSEQKKDVDEEQSQPLCYLKKSMLGGILLFELHMVQPFFTAKLRVIECNRLQTKSSTALVNQFMLSFVDASEKIKINMHLHSFTYDFHLRCIYSYIAGGGHWSLQQGYDLIHFLDDFLKYYSKAPNFARNLVDSDTVTISNLTTPAHTLYAYLLSHERTYGMQVFGMTNAQDISESEYVLVRLQSTPLVSYCDAQDTKYTDDFTVALIVSKQDQPLQLEKSEITLKYYLLLTSKRELYPKRELGNNKLGKFRTVYNVVKTTSGSHVESLLESSPSATPTSLSDKSSRDESNTDFDLLENKSTSGYLKLDGAIIEDQKQIDEILAPTPPPVPSSPLMTLSTMRTAEVASPHLIQIRQESVNYLGYYSSHEQLMQQLIVSQARAARKHITTMIERGMLHCRTHLLWNKLLENKSTMLYAEFMELRSLARVESLSNLDSRLRPLVNQPINWYQSLAKVLQNKYQEHYKQFSTTDGNVIHHLILHPSYLQAVMMLTVDTHSSRGELYVVYRKSAEITSMPFSMNEVRSLIEGFINACCFHLWVGLCGQ
ncbi:hypothetical protein PV327_008097 [Microctonus hyperodae]|uniref:Protein SZT2 n=1 Tax=Microctonus hyperodae TaxID=165561 RepID=A0AA39KGJ0_MICHY|nr:hypothetical protein PV327_008097 [Microctonus hyperodae]